MTDETNGSEVYGSYTGDRLVCIRDETSYYRTTRRVAKAILTAATTSDQWRYTSKQAWRRNNGKYIEAR